MTGQLGVGRDARRRGLGITVAARGHGALEQQVAEDAAGGEPRELVAVEDVFPPPGVEVQVADALLGDPAQDELAADLGEPLAAQVEDQRRLEHAPTGTKRAAPTCCRACSRRSCRPSARSARRSARTARRAGTSAGSRSSTPACAALAPWIVMTLPWSRSRRKRVGVPEIDVLADEILRPDGARVGGGLAQRVGGGRVGELGAHGVEFLGGEEQPVGGLERRGEIRGLQVFLPALVVALPLREVGGEARRALQQHPVNPAVAGAARRERGLDGQRADALRPVEREPLLALGRAHRLAAARARAGVGLGVQRENAALGQRRADDDPVVGRAVEVERAGEAHDAAVGGGLFPLPLDPDPVLPNLEARDAVTADGPLAEFADLGIVEGLEDGLGTVDGGGAHGDGKGGNEGVRE